MLVLSRQRDESIKINDDITITIVDIRGDKVRLGVEAPIQYSVHRQEVYEAIQRENRNRERRQEELEAARDEAAARKAGPSSQAVEDDTAREGDQP